MQHNQPNQPAGNDRQSLPKTLPHTGIAVAGLDGKFTAINDHFATITGFAIAELLGGMCLLDITPGRATGIPAENIYQWPHGGETAKAYRRKDGSTVWIYGYEYMLYGKDGKPCATVIVAGNNPAGPGIGSQVNEDMAGALTESEARMKITLESATDYAIITIDTDRKIESWSSGAVILFGYTEAEVLGRSADIIFTEEDRLADIPGKEMHIASHTGRAADDRWHEQKDGSRFFVNGVMCPIYDNNHVITGYVKVARDMTRQQLFTEELHQQVTARTAELQRSNEDLRQFAHVASHDMKEPARKIQTFSNRLLLDYGDLLPDKGKLYLQKIISATDRIFNMIEGVLNYSKADQSQLLVDTVDLNEMMQKITVDLEMIIQHKQAQVSVAAMPAVQGYRVLLYQLFYNLLLNALKFTGKDKAPRIRITAGILTKEERNYYSINVADNGIGFEQAYAQRIFEPFTRLNTLDEYEGTGLGLALCRRIADRHQGTISATAVPGEGAIFTVLLPAEQLQDN